MKRKLDGVTQNSTERKNPSGDLKGSPKQLPAYAGSDESPAGAKKLHGGKGNSGVQFGRGDHKERVYPTDTSNI